MYAFIFMCDIVYKYVSLLYDHASVCMKINHHFKSDFRKVLKFNSKPIYF